MQDGTCTHKDPNEAVRMRIKKAEKHARRIVEAVEQVNQSLGITKGA